MAKLPPEIDLIEILYGSGELSLPMVMLQVGEEAAWRVIPALALAKVAEVWVAEAREARQLADWELARLFRVRLRGSAEPAPEDEFLLLRAGERIADAYERDFGNWYYSNPGQKEGSEQP